MSTNTTTPRATVSTKPALTAFAAMLKDFRDVSFDVAPLVAIVRGIQSGELVNEDFAADDVKIQESDKSAIFGYVKRFLTFHANVKFTAGVLTIAADSLGVYTGEADNVPAFIKEWGATRSEQFAYVAAASDIAKESRDEEQASRTNLYSWGKRFDNAKQAASKAKQAADKVAAAQNEKVEKASYGAFAPSAVVVDGFKSYATAAKLPAALVTAIEAMPEFTAYVEQCRRADKVANKVKLLILAGMDETTARTTAETIIAAEEATATQGDASNANE